MVRTALLFGAVLILAGGCSLTFDDDIDRDSLARADSLRIQDFGGKSWLIEGKFDSTDYRSADSSWFVHWSKRDSKHVLHGSLTVLDSSARGFSYLNLAPFALKWSDTSVTVFDPAKALEGDRFTVVIQEVCSKTQALEFQVTRKDGSLL